MTLTPDQGVLVISNASPVYAVVTEVFTRQSVVFTNTVSIGVGEVRRWTLPEGSYSVYFEGAQFYIYTTVPVVITNGKTTTIEITLMNNG